MAFVDKDGKVFESENHARGHLRGHGIDGYAYSSGNSRDEFSTCMITVGDLAYSVFPLSRVDWFFHIEEKHVKVFCRDNHIVIKVDGGTYLAHLIRVEDSVGADYAEISQDYADLLFEMLSEASPLLREKVPVVPFIE